MYSLVRRKFAGWNPALRNGSPPAACVTALFPQFRLAGGVWAATVRFDSYQPGGSGAGWKGERAGRGSRVPGVEAEIAPPALRGGGVMRRIYNAGWIAGIFIFAGLGLGSSNLNAQKQGSETIQA